MRAFAVVVLSLGILATSVSCEDVAHVDHSDIGGQGGSAAAGGTGGTGGAVCVPEDDQNPCTDDVCEDGVPVHPPTQAGSPCSEGGSTLCDGLGACVECLAPSDCPGRDDACQTRTCTQNVCAHDFAASGTALPIQTAGDCLEVVCDGDGGTTTQNKDDDTPNDQNACTDDVCTEGVPSNPAKTEGTSCGVALLCDASGHCVGCNVPGDCPGRDDECHTRTCELGTCGVSFTAANTMLVAQTSNDCLSAVCDGLGNITAIADDTDKPLDDGNACTDEVCNAGAAGHPTKADGAVCDDGDACTQTDTCQNGACAGANPLVCIALDQCHLAGACDPANGGCSNPVAANDTPCDDSDPTTSGDRCVSGACTPTTTCGDGNQNQGETGLDCGGPCPACNGGAAQQAALSCDAIHQSYPALGDASYWIDPDGSGGAAAFQAYCDMTTAGGGWTRCYTAASGTISFSTWQLPGNTCFGSFASNNELLLRGSSTSASYLQVVSGRHDTYANWCKNDPGSSALPLPSAPVAVGLGSQVGSTNYWSSTIGTGACYIGGNNDLGGDYFYGWNHNCGGTLTVSAGATHGSGCDYAGWALGDLWVFWR